jgi:hypothetical protein
MTGALQVSKQEFLDTNAASAAKAGKAGGGGGGGGARTHHRSAGSETSMDMSTWAGNRTGAGLCSGLSAPRARSCRAIECVLQC